MTQPQEGARTEDAVEVEIEWEEWDGQSPFLHHCIAGSIAGVAEHTLLYPVDTVKTHMQAYCSTCPNNPANKSVSSAVSAAASASASSSSSNVCTSSAATSGSASASHTAATRISPPSPNVNGSAPSGMLSTMKNLIQYGHSTQPVLNSSRQAVTLAAHDLPNVNINGTTTAITSTSNNPLKLSTPKPKLSNGYIRLFRGVQTMAVGCVPAHALYFSSYEYTKALFSTTTTTHSNSTNSTHTHTHLGPLGASCAGATSTFLHDVVMTPLDTIKQRMQLGHYRGMSHAFRQIVQLEGWGGLYRSFGVTVFTNMPYGMVMVSTNEFLRDVVLEWKLKSREEGGVGGSAGGNASVGRPTLDVTTTLLAGCGAGMIAAAVTAPLDRVKTRLQTQHLATQLPIDHCPKAFSIQAATMDLGVGVGVGSSSKPQYVGWNDAFSSIVKEEGVAGLFRGMVPRLCTHAPAVAISWTAYESAKKWLLASA